MTMHKFGTLTPVIYFIAHRDPRHAEGYVMLAAYSSQPTPAGYSREYADTLAAVDRLQKRLQEQTRREFDAEREAIEAAGGSIRRLIRDRLMAKLASSSTSEHDKDFIRSWLVVREDRRDEFARHFEMRNAFIHARENDLGDRDADDESFHPDRIDVEGVR
jgi:hypothetical protein